MKTLFIECNMGAAGDMLMAALLELCPNQEDALRALNALGIPGVEFRAEKSEKCGIVGTHMCVLIHGEEEGAAEEAGNRQGCKEAQSSPGWDVTLLSAQPWT